MFQYASKPNNINSSNGTRDPLQINLRIFINTTQTEEPFPPIYKNLQSISTLIPISHHPSLYKYPNLQYTVQNNPIMIPLNNSKSYNQISPIARQQIIPEKYNKIVFNNQKHQQFKYIRRNFTPSNPPPITSMTNYDNSSQEKVKKQHIDNKITQENRYPIISPPQKQISIFCPICQKNINKSLQQQHKQYHKNRINNKFTQIPELQLSKQVKIDRKYTKEQLFKILMQYQERQRLKQAKIQCEYAQNNQNNIGKYQINHNIEKEYNSSDPKGIDFYYTQQIYIPNPNIQTLPYRQLISPNITRITPDDQSQCFIQQRQIISVPYSLKNRNDILIGSYQNTLANPKSEMKQTKQANYQKGQQHDFYRTVLQSHSQSQKWPKKKKLPSNKIAFQINYKN